MRRLPPLTALRAFEAAARHLSFKAAADELGLTPTAVSHQIRVLETVAGSALFRRRPRPLTLTTAGVALFPVVRNSFEAIADVFAVVRNDGACLPSESADRDGVHGTANSDVTGPKRVATITSPPRRSLVVLPFA